MYALNCVIQVDSFGGSGVMVWARIYHGGRTVVVHVAGALTGISIETRYCSITSFRT